MEYMVHFISSGVLVGKQEMLGTRAGHSGQAESPRSRPGHDIASKVEIRWPLVIENLLLFCLGYRQNSDSRRQGVGSLVGLEVEL